MATIGAVTCDIVDALVETLRPRTELWDLPGFDGFGAQLLGRGGAAVRIRAVEYDSANNVEGWLNNVEQLQGTIVSITDGFGVTYTDCLLTFVRRRNKMAVLPQGARGEIEAIGVRLE